MATQDISQQASEPLTEELLERLLASTTPEAYLEEAPLFDRSLSEYAYALLEEKGLTRSAVIQASGINATYCYQIFQGTRHPTRDHVIMLAFGLGCSLTETQRLLRYAGVNELWVKLRRDAIIIHCVQQGMTRAQCDDELYRLGEETLLPAEG